MKLMHLSDLHIGKRIGEVSLMEDQAYILDQILAIAAQEQPDAVLIAGDVYDKSVPSGEAVQLLDRFLCRLAERNYPVILISGNHDSAERLAFGGQLLAKTGLHISPVYDGSVPCVTLTDRHGPVNIYLLPFLKPAHVRRFFPEAAIESYTDAVRTALTGIPADPAQRNVLVTHQFVTGAERCESEELSVGGTDNVDAAVFSRFDYVALGHIHGPQNITETIRYCGTPLKYSFSECGHKKSITFVQLEEKGNITHYTRLLTPLRDLRQLKGTYRQLTERSSYLGTATEDYLHIILTDEEDVPEAMGRLQVIYPNLMKLTYDNTRTRSDSVIESLEDIRSRSPLELFCRLYELQNNQPMSPQQLQFTQSLIEDIWGGAL